MERCGGKERCAQEEEIETDRHGATPLPCPPPEDPCPLPRPVLTHSCSRQAHRNVARLSRHCSPAVRHTLGWASSHSSGPHTGR